MAGTAETAVSMTGAQLTEILAGMQVSMMEALQKVINNNNTATASLAASAAATAQAAAAAAAVAEQVKPEKKEFTPKFDPKGFSRLDKFSGGDAA